MDRYFIKIKTDGTTERITDDGKLETLQKAVGGPIEVIPLKLLGNIPGDFLFIVNERGKLLDLEVNFRATFLLSVDRHMNSDIIVGDVLVAISSGEDIIGLQMDMVEEVEKYVRKIIKW